jgi:hypothetical protein
VGLAQEPLRDSPVVLFVDLLAKVLRRLPAGQYPRYPQVKVPPANQADEFVRRNESPSPGCPGGYALACGECRFDAITLCFAVRTGRSAYKLSFDYDRMTPTHSFNLDSGQTNDIVQTRHADSPEVSIIFRKTILTQGPHAPFNDVEPFSFQYLPVQASF